MSPSKLARGYYWTDSRNVSNSLLTLTLTLTLLSSRFRQVAPGFCWVPKRTWQNLAGFDSGYGF